MLLLLQIYVVKSEGEIEMQDWKTPDCYREEYLVYHCSFETRQEIGCTEKFYEPGFFNIKTSHWDLYAE